MVNSLFKNILSAILNEIESADSYIRVAVYWFTNLELFNALYQKQLSGVQCTLIVHNDYINNRVTGLPFQKFIDAGGKIYFSDEENPMHNKFCIIDGLVVINGSYNWTYYAEWKNKENITIIKEDPKVISDFEIEFFSLTQLCRPVIDVTPLTSYELESNNLLNTKDYLAHDIIFQAKCQERSELVQAAFELAPENLNIQKIASELGLIRRNILNSSIGLSIVNDKVKVIAKKGTPIPATFDTVVRTSYDNQTKSITDVIYGEAEFASHNTKLATLTMHEIPSLPAGKAEIKFTFSIDIVGHVKIEKLALDTGKKEEINLEASWLIE